MKFCNEDYISHVGIWKHEKTYPCEISVQREKVTAHKAISFSLFCSNNILPIKKGKPGYDYGNYLICITVDEGTPGESQLIKTPANRVDVEVDKYRRDFYTMDDMPVIESTPLMTDGKETGHMWKIKSGWMMAALNKHVIGELLSIDELLLGPK